MWSALVVLLACACAAERAPPAKRAESEFMSPMPFVLGSRYGRSQPRLIAPRNDRFFMGSRYGKRSESRAVSPVAAVSQVSPVSGAVSPGSLARLLCEPTPLYQLYRCTPRPAPNSRRLLDEADMSQSGEDE